MKNRFWGMVFLLSLLLLSCETSVKEDTSSPPPPAGPATYTVRFITDNASTVYESVPVTAPEYKLSIVPTPPAKPGYRFSGWFTELEGLGTKVVARMDVSSSFDAYEHWSDYLYTITFDSRLADTPADPQTMTAGSPLCNLGALPSEPLKTGYLFGGWYLSSDGSGDRVSASTVFSADTTVYAKWDSYEYTVTYEADNGNASAHAVKNVSSPSVTVSVLPSIPVKRGYDFGGWYTLPNGGGTVFTASSLVTSSQTVYAKWVPYTRTVTFNGMGATTAADASTIEVVSPSWNLGALPSAPKKTGYVFGGWFSHPEGQGDEITAASEITASLTAYAYWKPYGFTVSFDSGDGSGTPFAEKNVISPATSVGTLPAPPERTGYEFGGWFTGENGTGTSFTATSTVTASITVYASWLSYSRTVAFSAPLATTPASVTSITVNSPAVSVGALPVSPRRTGYLFGGWYTQSEGAGSLFTATTAVTGNMTVYAHWLPYSYTIGFDDDGAEIPASSAHKIVESPATTVAVLPSPPQKSGYTFQGWYTEKNGGGTPFTASTPVTGSLTVYAWWLPNAFVTTTISMPAVGPVTITNNNFTVAKGTSIVISVAETSYDRYQWYLNGALQASSIRTITISTASLAAGVHAVMIVTTDSNGLGSSASCRFTVTN